MGGLPYYRQLIRPRFLETPSAQDCFMQLAPDVKVRLFGVKKAGDAMQHPVAKRHHMITMITDYPLWTFTKNNSFEDRIEFSTRGCLLVPRQGTVQGLPGCLDEKALIRSWLLALTITTTVLNAILTALMKHVKRITTAAYFFRIWILPSISLCARKSVNSSHNRVPTLRQCIILVDLNARESSLWPSSFQTLIPPSTS